MADISKGPVDTLPYSRHLLPESTMCDLHPKRKAVARVQGETDSFGCEYNDVCKQCLKELRDYQVSAEARSGICEWCKEAATDLRDRRDCDEGMAGRVYRVCGACVKRDNDRIEEELRDSGYYDNCDWDEPDDDWLGPDLGIAYAGNDYVPPPQRFIPTNCKKCGQHWESQHICRPKIAARVLARNAALANRTA